MKKIVTWMLVISLLGVGYPVNARIQARTGRSSCGTLSGRCIHCVAAGCAWSQSLQPKTFGTTNQGYCLESCDYAGTDANCFVSQNYVGLSLEEICSIADRTISPSPTNLDIVVLAEEAEHVLITETPTITPVPISMAAVFPQQADETTNDTVMSNESEGTEPPATPETTFAPSFIPLNNNHNAPSNATISSLAENATTIIENSANPNPVSCAGFVACEYDCPNGFACVYVAHDCSAFCPDLNHLTCYSIDGNYTNMTKSDICAGGDENELLGGGSDVEDELEPQVIFDVARAVASSGVVRGSGSTTMGILVAAISLSPILRFLEF